jgi:Flp pilus assembly protein TadD
MTVVLLATAVLALAQPEDAASRQIPVTSTSNEAKAEFLRARSFFDNVRVEEATAALNKALQLDPDFASAHALLATLLPAREAEEHVRAALAHAAPLPEAERVQIEAFAATVRGDNARARELLAKLVEVAPWDWRAHNQLGAIWLGDRDFPKAQAEFRKAVELNPGAAGAYNNLGYAYAGERKYAEAADTFRKYAEIAPEEPNAHDSLAEVLMNSGQLAEAEAEFHRALEVRPRFAQAWTGIAQTRYLRGDWTAGDEALEREKAMDDRPVAVLGAEANVAIAKLAEGKADDAWKRLDEVERKAKPVSPGQAYFTEVVRARLLTREGNLTEAIKRSKAVLASSERSSLPVGAKANVRRAALAALVRAQSLAGKKTDAQKSLADLEVAIKPVVQNAFFASSLQDARGAAALARGNAATALAEMNKCTDVDFNCQYDRIRALQAAGDEAGATAAREAFLRTPVRGIEYVYLWKKLGGATTIATGTRG